MTDTPASTTPQHTCAGTLRLALLLSASALGILAASPAGAQNYSCPAPSPATDTEPATCTIPDTAAISNVTVLADPVGVQSDYVLTNNAAITSDQEEILEVNIVGNNGIGDVEGADDEKGTAVYGGTTTLTNNGAITALGGTAPEIRPIFVTQQGGNGVQPSGLGNNGGRGGDGGIVTVTNNGTITITGSGTIDPVAARAILAQSIAGDGGPQGNGARDERGGNGGDAKDVTVNNNAAITIGSADTPLLGTNFARAIEAGGNGGTGGPDNGSGGTGAQPTVTNTADISIYWAGDETTDGVIGIYGYSTGNVGDTSNDNSDPGGKGEGGKHVALTNSADITIDATFSAPPAAQSAAMMARSTGGSGGESSNKNVGGAGGPGSSDATTKVSHSAGTITVSGTDVSGIVALSAGGDGGSGNGASDSSGGAGGAGGDIELDILAGGRVVTRGASGYAMLAQSIGGIGGGNAATAGTGGAGGTVTVNADAGTSIETVGDYANGITLHSLGGGGGVGADFTGVLVGGGGTGGPGGNAGDVTIDNGARLGTEGQYAYGVLGQSIGGGGGHGGVGTGLLIGLGGDGGGGGVGATVTINNTGDVATKGYGANAIVAQGISGGGGAAGTSGGALSIGGDAGAQSSSSAVPTARITSNGNVATVGDAAIGLLAQAVGGGGGSAAGSSGLYSVGGTGSGGGDGGNALIYHVSGTILTAGDHAYGILAQSIGGGGGTGGDALDVSVAGVGFGVGGSAGGGGDGGAACVTNFYDNNCPSRATGADGYSYTDPDSGTRAPSVGRAFLTTYGDFAHGVVVQSIGGGGGTGGSVTGIGAVQGLNVQIGGSGGAAAAGGPASIVLREYAASTNGDNAIALLAQSIGGGGGTGGSASSTNGETLVPISIGGTSGNAGAGQSATIDLGGSFVFTLGAHAHGVVAQSIGGGGGTGGAASAIDDAVGFSFATSIGAGGGAGGDGGNADAVLRSTRVATGYGVQNELIADATDAIGLVVQSVGGSGGTGGASASKALALLLPDFDGTSFAAAASVAVGGKGGVAGDGGAAEATVAGLSHILTGGDGSHGIVIQSVGGGGGNAGGASSLASVIGDSDTVQFNASASVGNDGGGGGSGGEAVLYLKGRSRVDTAGDHAQAVVVQSIAGGGGNAGVGSAVNNEFGGGAVAQVEMGLGGTGGSGGVAGEVFVTTASGTAISTTGSGSRGILVQSIGGGGGTSTGGTIGLSAAYEIGGGDGEGDGGEGGGGSAGDDDGGGDDGGNGDDDDKLGVTGSVSVAVGRAGGSGQNGNTVMITADGSITTTGDDADGIHAQSIGGGGGLGGSMGDDAGAPSDGGAYEGIIRGPKFDMDTEIGGTGGTGSDGGDVDVTHGGTIATKGDYADGIVAQSLGGGGGTGGTAVSQTVNARVQVHLGVGGTGGTGGVGNAVAVTLDASDGKTPSISTEGRHAYGVLMQSIGGGGGQGADGSTNSKGQISIGGGRGGSGGAAGDAGTVTLDASSGGTITTAGDDAFGILAQSIGGGGGVGASGTSTPSVRKLSLSADIAVGGEGGASGEGASVSIGGSTAVTTSGDRAIAILAQSVGGGGGVGGSSAAQSIASATVGGDGTAGGTGGTVTVDMTGSITTHGDGAFGILAQSVGGGGGLAGDVGGGLSSARGMIGTNGGAGDGGAVSVTYDGTLATTGDRAFGIVAQSIAGGGGIVGDAGGVSFGSAGGGDVGGSVYVHQAGTLSTSGEGSAGIFAQSLGAASDTVTVDVAGTVVGGTGADGTAVFISEGTSNVSNIAAGAIVSAGDGDALAYRFETAYAGTLTVNNSGTINGDVSMVNASGETVGTISNQNGGVWNPDGASAASVVNAGAIDLTAGAGDAVTGAVVPAAAGETRSAASRGGTGFGVFSVTGDYTQARSGTLRVGADFAAGTAHRLEVGGDVSLAGTVEIDAISLQRDVEIAVVSAAGRAGGALTARDTRVVDYAARRVGSDFAISVAGTDFAGAFEDFTPNARAAASHLDAIFDGGSGRYATALAALADLAEVGDGADYARAVATLTPGASQAMAAAQSTLMRERLDAALHCRQLFGAQTVDENVCAWASGRGAHVGQRGQDGYDGPTWGLAIGAQAEVSDRWIVGGAAGFEQSDFDASNGLSSVEGASGYLSASVGRRFGGITVSGGFSGSWGTYDTRRTVLMPGFAGTAEGDTDLATIGGRIRAAYQADLAFGYVQPRVDLDVVYTHASGYTERGGGIYNLDVSPHDRVAFVASPAIEFGLGRMLGDGLRIGGFAVLGASFSTLDDWETDARLEYAPRASGTFESTVPIAAAIAEVDIGLTLSHAPSAIDARVEYNGAFGNDFSSHGGMLRINKRF
ncbi:autotransporter outer membrane beta-barrel domain-containing protein [Acuticoccus sp. I52.16.1]|uniref:autotransporter outer membrane beta-barrel domain-containing protein n=1 Tax=Acuticoccus sp. I52.16.1 TaxID=2928472 RepID=UPI001FD15B44|nr:autotransporter outer membrane beta-barrel domain-containing protein [Acuticoccus sp. I52.16.1]UOM33527.1 autotransporter outer membrane beta-barrel domain-containing protein [Acuticoccus sp. I52.16.1]